MRKTNRSPLSGLTRTCPRNAIVILSSLARPALAGRWLAQHITAGPPDDAKTAAGPKQGPAEGNQQAAFAGLPEPQADKQPGTQKDEKPQPDKDADRVKLVRQMYAKLPCDILGFAEPAKKFVVAQTRGTAINLILEDANGKPLSIFLLRGKGGDPPDSLLITVGKLPPRGPEESAVYGLLLRLAATPPEKTMAGLLQAVDAILAVLDERFAGAMPIALNGAKK